MKTLPCVTLTLLLSVCTSSVLAQESERIEKATADASIAPDKKIIQKVMNLWSTLDASRAAPYYAPDADLIFFDTDPMEYKGWAAYEKGVQQSLNGFKSLKLTVNDDVLVHRHGNLAWTTATWHGDAETKDGQKLAWDGRHTQVWEKRYGKWLIVHEHLSLPQS